MIGLSGEAVRGVREPDMDGNELVELVELDIRDGVLILGPTLTVRGDPSLAVLAEREVTLIGGARGCCNCKSCILSVACCNWICCCSCCCSCCSCCTFMRSSCT